ncbi:MAG: hypothetical protein ACFE96_06115 [Candidatus Hermodarchaeota archaeon]
MIGLEDNSQKSSDLGKKIQVLGIGLITLTDNQYNIVFNRGINRSLIKDLIHIYRSEILNRNDGNIIDEFGIYMVYIHFYTFGKLKVSIFYLSEKEKSLNYDELSSFSNLLVKTYCSHVSREKISQICNSVIPIVSGVSAFLVISTTGQTLFKKIRSDKKNLLENYIQIGGFLSAILSFSNEIIGKQSGECLKAIDFENSKFLITVEEGAIFAFLLDQCAKSKTIERYIELLTEEFIELYYDCLKDFNCDVTQFRSFEAVVENYFSI